MNESEVSRRPLKTRNMRWASALARGVASAGLRPNQISILSIVFAALGAVCLVFTSYADGKTSAWLFAGAAAAIQLRLLCNLLDGMVAVEGGFRTKSGEIYNELPDRVADALIFGGAGYSLGSSSTLVALGWAAAVLAVITAYVRALGVATGASQYFLGPMAKPHRMAVMTVACLGTAGMLAFGKSFSLVEAALWVVVIGCAITSARRCVRIVRQLEGK